MKTLATILSLVLWSGLAQASSCGVHLTSGSDTGPHPTAVEIVRTPYRTWRSLWFWENYTYQMEVTFSDGSSRVVPLDHKKLGWCEGVFNLQHSGESEDFADALGPNDYVLPKHEHRRNGSVTPEKHLQFRDHYRDAYFRVDIHGAAVEETQAEKHLPEAYP